MAKPPKPPPPRPPGTPQQTARVVILFTLRSGLLRPSGFAQVPSMRRQEQILDRHDAFRNALLVQVARQCFERWPVGLDTIGPRVTAKYLVELVDVGGHPRQHVLQRTEIAHTRPRPFLGRTHRIEKTAGDERVLLVHVAA